MSEGLENRILTNQPITEEDISNVIEQGMVDILEQFMTNHMAGHLRLFLRWTKFNGPAVSLHDDVFTYLQNHQLIIYRDGIYQLRLIG